MDQAGWRELILAFLDEQFFVNGMVDDWALHALNNGQGGWIKRPHMHAPITGRLWKGSRIGQPQPSWLTTENIGNALGVAWVATVGGAI